MVVAGRWNPALFTPAAISRRIFQLPESTAIEVYVVLDDVQLPRMKHAGITVAPSASQLVLSPERCAFDQLERAREIARKAIQELPRTPLIAAGFNLRYRAETMPPALARRFSDELDRRFSDRDFEIVGRQFHRLLTFRAGRLLVQVTREPDGKAELLMNFEQRSKDATVLGEWLAVPAGEVRETAITVLSRVLELRDEDYVIERDEHAGQQQGSIAAGAG